MKQRVQSILLLAGVGFLLYIVYDARDAFRDQLTDLNMLQFAAAVVLGAISSVIAAWLLREIFHKYGIEVGFMQTCQLLFYGQLAKYIPGKVWSLMYQAMALGRRGTLPHVAIVNLEMMLILLLVVSGIAVLLWLTQVSVLWLFPVMALGGWLIYRVARSCLMIRFLRTFAGRFTLIRNHLPNCSGRFSLIGFFGFVAAFTGIYVLSHWLFLESFLDLDRRQFVLITACLAGSWVIGMATLVFPGGVGVRELVFILLAAAVAPDELEAAFVSIAVLGRLMVVLQEVLGALGFYVVSRCIPR